MDEMQIGSASVVNISTTSSAAAWVNPNNVDFKVEFSASLKEKPSLTEGEIINVSKEAAADFAAKGFGRVYTDEDRKADDAKKEAAEAAESTGTKKPYAEMKKAELQAELTSRSIEFDAQLKNADLISLLEADDAKKENA